MKKKNYFSKKQKIILGGFLLTSAAWCIDHFFITKGKEEKVCKKEGKVAKKEEKECEKKQDKHKENNLFTMKWSLIEINTFTYNYNNNER